MQETAYDLRYNVAAMYIAILRDDVFTPEQAFRVLEDKDIARHRVSGMDARDMAVMKRQGMTYKEISKIYGMCESGVLKRIKGYKEKTNLDGSPKRSND